MTRTIAVIHLGRHGGGPKFTHELAQAVRRGGTEVIAVAARKADNREAVEEAGPTLLLSTFDSALGAVVRSPMTLFHAVRFGQVLLRRDVSAVVIGMEQIWQVPLVLAARLLGRPVLVCVHDGSMHPGEDNLVERSIRRMHRGLASGLITFSDHVAQTLRAGGAQRVFRSVHGAFGHEDASPPRRYEASSRPPIVGFFGRLARYKGLEVGYEAVQILRASGRRVVFRVVGDGDRSTVPAMSHGDDDLRHAWVADEEVGDILRGFDLLLLPYIEASQSGVLAYAASAALPAVVTPVGGLREQASDTGAAVVAREVSAVALAEELRALLDDPDRWEELSRRAAQATRGVLSWDRVAHDVDAALTAVLEGGRPEGSAAATAPRSEGALR